MFLTVHATAAIIVAKNIQSPLLGFVLGFLSHLVLDAIPHGDSELFEEEISNKKLIEVALAATIDFFLALAWLFFLYKQEKIGLNLPTLTAVFGSILPDFLNGFYILTKNRLFKWSFNLNNYIHHLIIKNPPKRFGYFLQVLFFIFLVLYLF